VRRADRAPDELLAEIAFPALPPEERGTFVKIALRKAQAIAVVNAAVVLAFDRATVRRARVALGSVAPTIVRAAELEAFLAGRTLDDQTVARAGELAAAAASPIDDVRGTAAYRREMVRVATRRALQQLASGRERASWPERPVMLWGQGDGRFPPRRRELTLVHGRSDDRGNGEGERPIETTINGHSFTLAGAHDKSLLRLLREDAGLIGTKEGCAEGECGACTVFLDGLAVMACLVPAARAHGATIVTIEGLAGQHPGTGAVHLHPLQQAFIDQGAVQCGYCTPGFLMAGAKLLEERPAPNDWEIRHSMTGNLCRCTGYYKIIAAFAQAAQALQATQAVPVATAGGEAGREELS
jgi:carbon-monoxide dehydrogenase medium subunit